MFFRVPNICQNNAAIVAILGVFAASAMPLSAHATTFSYDGTIDTYTVVTTGIYDVFAAGAQGGDNANSYGGLGATVEGDILLTAGQVLSIVVGGAGINGLPYPGGWASSGGGGSFVFEGAVPAALNALAVAGGGGGAGYYWAGENGGAGQAGLNGGAGGGSSPGAGGVAGAGGGSGPDTSGGGGAGLLGNGASNSDGDYGGGGGHSLPSFAGGASEGDGPAGSFGGGGAGGFNYGGGGGGYSGGGAGGLNYGGGADGSPGGGGGGGSYLSEAFSDDVAIAFANSGNGEVDITRVSAVPEPATLSLLAIGMFGLRMTRRRRA
jgi:hypothetical protein